jgi:hypothetical protein
MTIQATAKGTISRPANLQALGLTPDTFEPYKLQVQGNKLFALIRLCSNIPPDPDGFSWINIKGSSLADFIAFKIKHITAGNGGYVISVKTAQIIKEDY